VTPAAAAAAAALTVAADGWCAGAARYDSPHCEARPDGAEAELLVLHNVSLPAGRFGGPHVSDLFTGRLDYNADPSFADLRGLRVSAHFFVRRDGRLVQYVSGNDKAWHAGLSAFRGRPRCNEFSIGVELEGSDFVAFTTSQYATLAALTAALQARYGLREVCGHEHIAPGRKTDPGPCFDWDIYKKTLDQIVASDAALVLTHRVLRFPATL
jgi:AmpD protein